LRGLDPRVHFFVSVSEGVDGRAKPGQIEISGPISTLYPPCIAGPAEAG
jgi:hypothetical protein